MNTCLLTILAFLIIALAPATAASDAVVRQSCGAVPDGHVTDYRLKDTSNFQGAIDDVNRNHLEPAVRALSESDYSPEVIGDLGFILNHWPNHYPALQALIKYKVGGGNADRGRYRSADCYFEIAHQFVPNDWNVLVLYGIYRYRSGDRARAEQYWKRAIEIEPDSAEAHYNLGLLYVEEARFDDALVHANRAYDLGYPLPGLRAKLTRAGYWPVAEEH
jgi:tetratricopeptide (TPR) repeat protein